MDERTLTRFMSRISVQPNGCWHWTGRINKAGYGLFTVAGKHERAHRFSYILFTGPIPDRLRLDHFCHTRDKECPGGPCLHRRCINPAHLEPVTARVNNLRGRGLIARNAAKTHCPKGHPYDEVNTYYPPSGGRACRICRKLRAREFQVTKRRKGPKPPPAHCPQGHPYEGSNLAFTKTGARRCRECARERARKRSRRITAELQGRRITPKPVPAGTFCPAGHEYTPGNTRFERNGSRKCRECGRQRGHAAYLRRKAAA
jgi:hypothetical protein